MLETEVGDKHTSLTDADFFKHTQDVIAALARLHMNHNVSGIGVIAIAHTLNQALTRKYLEYFWVGKRIFNGGVHATVDTTNHQAVHLIIPPQQFSDAVDGIQRLAHLRIGHVSTITADANAVAPIKMASTEQ